MSAENELVRRGRVGSSEIPAMMGPAKSADRMLREDMRLVDSLERTTLAPLLVLGWTATTAQPLPPAALDQIRLQIRRSPFDDREYISDPFETLCAMAHTT